MIASFFHIGVTVRDLDTAVSFFRDAMGMRVVVERQLVGDYLAEALAVPGLDSARICMLRMNGGAMLELVEYCHGISDQCDVDQLLQYEGAHHLAFFVGSMDDSIERLTAAGAVLSSEHSLVRIPSGPYAGKRLAFLDTGFGVVLEMIESPSELAD